MQPHSGNQRPDLLTSLMNMSLVLRLPRKMHLCRSSSNVPRLPSFLEMLQNPHVLLAFDKVHNPLRLPRETRSECPKVVVCFLHFDFKTCFAPQRRALFRHLNFQKWSEREVFLAFSLTNVLRTTMACICSSLIWPDGSAPAALASLLFDPPSASAHLCFSSVHIVGSLTSKLPSFVYFSAGTKAVMSKSRRFRSFAISIYMVLEHVKQWLLI